MPQRILSILILCLTLASASGFGFDLISNFKLRSPTQVKSDAECGLGSKMTALGSGSCSLGDGVADDESMEPARKCGFCMG